MTLQFLHGKRGTLTDLLLTTLPPGFIGEAPGVQECLVVSIHRRGSRVERLLYSGLSGPSRYWLGYGPLVASGQKAFSKQRIRQEIWLNKPKEHTNHFGTLEMGDPTKNGVKSLTGTFILTVHLVLGLFDHHPLGPASQWRGVTVPCATLPPSVRQARAVRPWKESWSQPLEDRHRGERIFQRKVFCQDWPKRQIVSPSVWGRCVDHGTSVKKFKGSWSPFRI